MLQNIGVVVNTCIRKKSGRGCHFNKFAHLLNKSENNLLLSVLLSK